MEIVRTNKDRVVGNNLNTKTLPQNIERGGTAPKLRKAKKLETNLYWSSARPKSETQ